MGMFGTTVESDAVFNDLVSKALAFAAVQEIGDSSIKKITRRNYNVSESSTITFIGKRGNMSDGLYVTLDGVTEDSYNILTNVVLPIGGNGQIAVSNSRFGNNLESVFVFINGYKVPDSSILLYMTDSYTNIIVPKKYFNPDITNDILVENRKFESYTYGGARIQNFSGTRIQFNVSSHRNLTIAKETCMIFNKGVYLPNEILTVNYAGGVATINLATPIINGDVEIFIDSSIKFSKTTNVRNNNVNSNGKYFVPYNIDHTFDKPINGPINNSNCMFFINGLRVDNLDVNQVGRLDFQFEIQRPVNDIATIIYTDEGLVPINRHKLYGDDYFLYNILGATNTTGVLCGNAGNPTLDIFFSSAEYKQILSGYLSYTNVTTAINALASITDGNLKIQKLLQLFPALVKDFLENFAANRVRKTVNYDGIGHSVIVGTTDQYYSSDTIIIRIIIVNDKVALIDQISVASKFNYWQSTVDASWFKLGDNVVEIFESIQTNNNLVSYKVVDVEKVDTIYTPFISYRAVTPVFGNIQDIDDIRVLAITKKSLDPDGVYFKDSKYGFRLVSGSECPRIIFNGKIYLDFGPIDPRIDILIVTSVKHIGVYTFIVQDDDVNYDSLFNVISVGTVNYFDTELGTNNVVNIPLIHNGAMMVSTGEGLRLFRDIDYFYRSPLDQDSLRQSGVILKRYIYSGTPVNVVALPNYTYNNDYPSLSIEDIYDDKYGLLYLGNLKFPFSSKYFDVYANNKHLAEDEIDILSNKLIRLTKSEVSLQDVCIETNFTVPYSALRPFIQLYSDSGLETRIGKLFACYDYYNLPQTGSVSKASADAFYESFGDEVLSNDGTQLTAGSWDPNKTYNINDAIFYKDIIYISTSVNIGSIPSSTNNDWIKRGKLPNPPRTQEYITTNYDLYVDAYLRWFISDKSKKIWMDFEYIPDQIIRELQVFRNTSQGDSFDVVVRSWLKDLISDIDLRVTPDRYDGFWTSGTVKTFLDCCLNNPNLTVKECFEQYDNLIESNIVFKRDLLPISATESFDGPDILIGGIS